MGGRLVWGKARAGLERWCLGVCLTEFSRARSQSKSCTGRLGRSWRRASPALFLVAPCGCLRPAQKPGWIPGGLVFFRLRPAPCPWRRMAWKGVAVSSYHPRPREFAAQGCAPATGRGHRVGKGAAETKRLLFWGRRAAVAAGCGSKARARGLGRGGGAQGRSPPTLSGGSHRRG